MDTSDPEGIGVVCGRLLSKTVHLFPSKLLVSTTTVSSCPVAPPLPALSHVEMPIWGTVTATFAPARVEDSGPRTGQLSGTVPDLTGQNLHPGPRDTDLPAAARGRSSTADPRLWRWSPAAARLAISGEARTPLFVGCSSQTSPHGAGQPGHRHSNRLRRLDARPRGTRCARQAP
jgi:hypothetical protein